MIVVSKAWLPAVFFCCFLGACSSSGGGVSDTGDAALDTIGDVPDTGDGVPDTSGGVPDTSGGVPNTGGGVPDTSGGVPNTGGGVPDTGDGVPDSSDETSNPDNGSSGIVGTAPVSIVQGDWMTDCMVDDDLRALIYMRFSLSVNGANYTQELAFFSDAECTVPASVGFLVNGSSVQVDGVTAPTGATVNTAQGAALAVDFFNGQPTIDNSPLPEALVGADGFSPDVAYDIVWVSPEGRLFFGDDSLPGYDGETPETRPISLNLERSFGRVQ